MKCEARHNSIRRKMNRELWGIREKMYLLDHATLTKRLTEWHKDMGDWLEEASVPFRSFTSANKSNGIIRSSWLLLSHILFSK